MKLRLQKLVNREKQVKMSIEDIIAFCEETERVELNECSKQTMPQIEAMMYTLRIVTNRAKEALKIMSLVGDNSNIKCINCLHVEKDIDFPDMFLCGNRESMVRVNSYEGCDIAVKPDFYCKDFSKKQPPKGENDG